MAKMGKIRFVFLIFEKKRFMYGSFGKGQSDYHAQVAVYDT